jgi:hypothetical protein
MLLAAGDSDGDVGVRADAGPLPRCTPYALRDQHTPSGPKARCSLARGSPAGKVATRSRWQQEVRWNAMGCDGTRSVWDPWSRQIDAPACP